MKYSKLMAQVRELRKNGELTYRGESPGSQCGTSGLARVCCTPAGPLVPAQRDITDILHEDNLG